MIGTAELLKIAAAYQRARKVSHWRVSTEVFKDGKKLLALREGATITIDRLQTAFQWFSDHWPDNATWPKGIERPRRIEAAE